SWTQGGRFYGGWWQRIPKESRVDIVINDKPTIEIDFKAMHVSILYAELGKTGEFDPYKLRSTHLDLSPKDQRNVIKKLVLTCINASSREQAFKAFRSDQEAGSPFKKFTNEELNLFLDSFLTENEPIRDYICTGKGLELMYRDSMIAERVIEHFTDLDIPVLSMHDSFIIQYDKSLDLRAKMVEAAGIEWKRFFSLTRKKSAWTSGCKK
ncbi:MAG: hypothetical protein HWD84_09665, partial [Flavobacteriaceae bacterium]|nr:hypothetical protein [Flavobacteriaceae bacterium]